MISKTTMSMGKITDKTETIVERISSKKLTGMLPAPAVVAVTAGRIAKVLTALTPPATKRPQARESMGEISVSTFALAANTIAPAVGRTID